MVKQESRGSATPRSSKPAPKPAKSAGRYEVRSLTKGLRILERVESNGRMRLTDLAKELGVERATLFRYCATLVELGYLTVDPRTKEYALGPRARAMAYAATAHSPSLTIIREELPVLANRFRGAASLGLLDGSQVLYIERAVAGQALNFQIAVGDRLPAAITSIGKALLATRLDSEVEALLGVQMGRAALDRLLSELATVRVEKMAFNIGGFQAGLNSVAVAVYEIGSNVPLGAINLAGAATSLGYERLRDEVAPALTAFSGELAAGSVAPE